jgi:hypothetical protein
VLSEEGERVAGVLDLLKADDAAELSFAFAAATHVEAQRDVTVFIEDACWRDAVRAVAVRAETVQHQERRAALARLQPVWNADNAVQAQPRRLKTDDLFLHCTAPPAFAAHSNGLAGRRKLGSISREPAAKVPRSRNIRQKSEEGGTMLATGAFAGCGQDA